MDKVLIIPFKVEGKLKSKNFPKRCVKNLFFWWIGDSYISENDDNCLYSTDIKRIRYRIIINQYGVTKMSQYITFEELNDILTKVQNSKVFTIKDKIYKLNKSQQKDLIKDITETIDYRMT